ncbi:hypothetical protein HAL1_16951 [Halomonas sp. HAL1]|nr:hypothetical protein HAL1_16951 [Halomonas sp. HAL1]
MGLANSAPSDMSWFCCWHLASREALDIDVHEGRRAEAERLGIAF